MIYLTFRNHDLREKRYFKSLSTQENGDIYDHCETSLVLRHYPVRALAAEKAI